MNPWYVEALSWASFGICCAGFAVRDVLRIRLLSAAGLLLGVAFNLLVAGGPIWSPAVQLATLAAINAAQYVRERLDRLPRKINHPDIHTIRDEFPGLNAGQLLRLLGEGRTRPARRGEVIARQGEALDHVCLVLDGDLEVSCERAGGTSVHRVRGRGRFVGDISYLRQHPLEHETVTFMTDGHYILWTEAALDRLQASGGIPAAAMSSAFVAEAIEKYMNSQASADAATLPA